MNYLKNGVKFDDYHSINDFGLITTNVEIGEPEPKATYVDIPGMNGSLDLTESMGEISYSRRPIKIEFVKKESDKLEHSDGYLLEQKIRQALHGKEMNISFDSDKTFYWIGRTRVTEFNMSNIGRINITVEADVEPYKYDVAFDGDRWLWNPFDFNSGIINLSRFEIDGIRSIVLINRDMPVSPVITATAPFTIIFNTKTINIRAGSRKVYDIRLQPGENTLTFKGTGIVDIVYKAGVL